MHSHCVLACGLKEKGMEWGFLLIDGLLPTRHRPSSWVGDVSLCHFILITILWARFYPISQLKTREIKLLAKGHTVRELVVSIKSRLCSSDIHTIHVCMSQFVHRYMCKYVFYIGHVCTCVYMYTHVTMWLYMCMCGGYVPILWL